MKARTKIQKEVVKLSPKLKPITQAQIKWAKQNCFSHSAYELKSGLITCMDCGEQWYDKTKRHSVFCICPKCNTELKTEHTRKKTQTLLSYCNIVTTFKNWQVVRSFLIIAKYNKGQAVRHSFNEVSQWWCNEKGQEVQLAKARQGFSFYYDNWKLDTPLEVRKENIVYEYISDNDIYPHSNVLPIFRRNGFKNNFYGLSPIILLRGLFDNKMETLIKTDNIKLLVHFLYSREKVDFYWDAIKIVIRKNYDIQDIPVWCDYIRFLKELNKDIKNSHYVCPQDIFVAHNIWQKKLQNKREKEHFLAKEQERLTQVMDFYNNKKAYFGIAFTDGEINIAVLDSIEAYKEEGKVLQHCVYENNYFGKNNSLILSATINGERVETIELSLESLQVIQARGFKNSISQYHDRIVNLVNKNIKLISQRMTA